MALQIEVLSKQNIKPSLPTPQHLKKHSLSFLDQIAPGVFMPLIYYYTADDQACNKRSDHLKKSLSDALTRFYPLAGRLTNNFYVDCNDEGAQYVESRVNCNLEDVIRNPIPNELNKLLPFDIDDVTVDFIFAVQVNFFKCGGIAIGTVISHKLADAFSFVNFMNTWAAIGRGDNNMPSPIFDLAKLFPPLDMSGFKDRTGVLKQSIVCKRFNFDASKINALKENFAESNKTASTEDPIKPTRFEALSAFIWNRYMAATQQNSEDHKNIYIMSLPVNLRTRFDPPLPKNYFGNLFRMAMFPPSINTDKKDAHEDLIKQAREAIRCIDTNYVEKLQKGEDHLMYMKEMAQKFDKGEVVILSFTSLSRFGLYDADFGWGKPIWIGSARMTFNNLVTFFDTKEGEGIEAWVNLKENEMVKFENDPELMSLVDTKDT